MQEILIFFIPTFFGLPIFIAYMLTGVTIDRTIDAFIEFFVFTQVPLIVIFLLGFFEMRK